MQLQFGGGQEGENTDKAVIAIQTPEEVNVSGLEYQITSNWEYNVNG